jgi:hypothetical protein
VPGYYDIITEPMDLGTVMSKLSRTGTKSRGEVYHSLEEVYADVHKVCASCRGLGV